MTPSASILAGLADVVLVLHVAIVVFVVGGLVLIVLGNVFKRPWHWVNAWWFRLAHLAAIAVVVAESWFGIACPLTTLEAWLRVRAGAPVHGGSGFIEHWLQRLLYYLIDSVLDHSLAPPPTVLTSIG